MNYTEIQIKVQKFSFMKNNLKMLAAKSLIFCLSLNVLNPETGVERVLTNIKLNKIWN